MHLAFYLRRVPNTTFAASKLGMAMAWYGQLASFQSDNDWDDYVESLDFFFIEISGTKGERKREIC